MENKTKYSISQIAEIQRRVEGHRFQGVINNSPCGCRRSHERAGPQKS